MKIPKTVKVGAFEFKVMIVPDDDPDFIHMEKSTDGVISHNGCYIKIVKGRDPQRMWHILWHEILHALDEHGQSKLDEDTVERLAYGICMVLKDNPKLVS